MSLSVVYTRAQNGITAPLVTVEVHLANGLPSLSIVGLPETAVKESKDRVRSALLSTHFEFPAKRITVNLAPADLPKCGGRYDLPIALGILAASGQIPADALAEYEFAGELGLTGELRAFVGALPFALATKNAKRILLIPKVNADEAVLVKDLTVLPAVSLMQVCLHLTKQTKIVSHKTQLQTICSYNFPNLKDVYGQQHAKRALEIAAAGGHNLLFVGSPGTGKTMLANRIIGILPDLSEDNALEVAAITSISTSGFNVASWQKRPFRSPHHSASSVALVGGGNPPKPGEISLAHHGVLFLDELPEFNRHVLEALREPLESGKITISRAAKQSEFPAKFQFIAAMNPCPCGYYNDKDYHCRCTQEQIMRYQLRISGPILDRIDMHVNVPRVATKDITKMDNSQNETSLQIKERVLSAQKLQFNKNKKLNAFLTNQELEKAAALSGADKEFLQISVEKLKLSARSYHRLLKVALTIANLNFDEQINKNYLAEAITFRSFKF